MLNMKSQLKKMAVSMLAAGLLLTGIYGGATANAASIDLGSTGALSDTDYTVEEMLVYAIEDENLAQAEYAAIMNAFGVQRPFSNIIKAEATHISLLTPLLKEYGVAIPEKDWASLVTVPVSIEEAYSVGITAEKNNIAMYENFLKKDIPVDVKDVFTALLNASNNHLAAFERQGDGSCINNGIGSSNGMGNGKGNRGNGNMSRANGSIGGFGQGNRSALQGSCITN